MGRLFMGLACVGLALGTTIAVGLTARSASAIPRPVPGGPGIHSVSWHQVRGISRALLLTIAHGENVSPSDRVALLQCPAAGGTHPRAAEACRLLEKTSGDVADLKASRDTACASQYDPVTVSASGIWDGRRLWFERTFGNPCELHADTGAVFNF